VRGNGDYLFSTNCRDPSEQVMLQQLINRDSCVQDHLSSSVVPKQASHQATVMHLVRNLIKQSLINNLNRCFRSILPTSKAVKKDKLGLGPLWHLGTFKQVYFYTLHLISTISADI
jgi:hypothetical protein